MAKHSDGPDGFEEALANGEDLLHRVAGLVSVNKILCDGLERVAMSGEPNAARLAIETLDRAKIVCKERL